jgi:predicted MFS family arabinose efflux permease
VTFCSALFLLIFGLIRGNPEGWGSPLIVASLVGSVALMAAFLAIEARSPHPMLDLTLFRKPAFVGVSAVAFALSAGMFSMFLYLTIYLQGVTDYSPLEAGVRFLPSTLLAFLVAPVAGKLSDRVPTRALLGLGLGLVGLGLLLMRNVDADSGWGALLAGFIVSGAGVGLTNPGIGSAAIAVVPRARAGMGSGINSTFRQVGLATGVAALGAVFQSRIETKLSELLPSAPPGLADLVASAGSRAAGQRPEVGDAAAIAFTSALDDILLIAALICFAGAILGLTLVRSSDFVAEEREAARSRPEPGPAQAQPTASS